jgi:hypothetical protein
MHGLLHCCSGVTHRQNLLAHAQDTSDRARVVVGFFFDEKRHWNCTDLCSCFIFIYCSFVSVSQSRGTVSVDMIVCTQDGTSAGESVRVVSPTIGLRCMHDSSRSSLTSDKQ